LAVSFGLGAELIEVHGARGDACITHFRSPQLATCGDARNRLALTAQTFRLWPGREARQVGWCFHCGRRFPKAIADARFDRRHRADPASDRLCYRALPRAD